MTRRQGQRRGPLVVCLVVMAVLAAMLVPGSGAGAQGRSNTCVWTVEDVASRSGGFPPVSSLALGDGASWSVTHQIEAWSPDRSRVAYIGYEGDDLTTTIGLRVSRPDGTRNRLVRDLTDPFFGTSPQPIQWSPNGRKIAIVGRFATADPVDQLFVVDVATGEITQVSEAAAGVIGTAAWSPDSRQLAWPQIRPAVSTSTDQRDVFVGNADGTGTPVEIITTAYFPAFSYPIDTRFDPPAAIDGLAFSPDGMRLVFTGWDFEGQNGFGDDLWVADADGSSVRQLANNDELDDPVGHSQPTWSPDGARLAVGVTSGTGSPPNNGVAILDSTSGATVRTFGTGNPTSAAAWSDDGTRVAFSADRGGGSFQNDVRIATVSSGTMRTVLRGSDEGLAFDLIDWVPCTAAPPTCNGRNATHIGTNGRDTIRGTNRADVIVSFGGNDRIIARGGNDRVCAGRGNDTVRAGAGKDRVFGEAGRDKLFGQAGNDRIDGGTGNDRCRPGAGRDRLVRCP